MVVLGAEVVSYERGTPVQGFLANKDMPLQGERENLRTNTTGQREVKQHQHPSGGRRALAPSSPPVQFTGEPRLLETAPPP